MCSVSLLYKYENARDYLDWTVDSPLLVGFFDALIRSEPTV